MVTRQTANGRNIGKEGWIVHYVLLLNDSVIAHCSQSVRQIEAIVEHPESAAHHGFRSRLALGSGRPRESDAGRKIMPVMNIGLGLIAQTETQGEIGTHAPVVARKYANVRLPIGNPGEARANSELGRHAARQVEQCAAILFDRSDGHRLPIYRLVIGIQDRRQAARKDECASEILRRDAVISFTPRANSETPGMLPVIYRCIVLKLVTVLTVQGAPNLGATSVERARHLDSWRQIRRHIFRAVAEELEACLVDHVGTQHRGLGDLHAVMHALGVVAARNQIKPANAGVINVHAGPPVADRQGVI